jgi:hypothetical protein
MEKNIKNKDVRVVNVVYEGEKKRKREMIKNKIVNIK